MSSCVDLTYVYVQNAIVVCKNALSFYWCILFHFMCALYLTVRWPFSTQPLWFLDPGLGHASHCPYPARQWHTSITATTTPITTVTIPSREELGGGVMSYVKSIVIINQYSALIRTTSRYWYNNYVPAGNISPYKDVQSVYVLIMIINDNIFPWTSYERSLHGTSVNIMCMHYADIMSTTFSNIHIMIITVWLRHFMWLRDCHQKLTDCYFWRQTKYYCNYCGKWTRTAAAHSR